MARTARATTEQRGEAPGSDIEIEQELRFQHGSWIVQRVGWGVIALVLLGGAAGLFGLGPAARSRVAVDSSLELEYYRIARRYAPLELQFRVQSRASGSTLIHLSDDLLERVEVQRIDPEPVSTQADDRGTGYVFRTGLGSSRITFHVEPTRAGRIRARIGSAEGATAVPLIVLP